MSIINSLKRLVDPEAIRREEQRHKAQREHDDEQLGSDELLPTWRCHVCGLVTQRSDYCPSCLAPTLRRVAEQALDEDRGKAR